MQRFPLLSLVCAYAAASTVLVLAPAAHANTLACIANFTQRDPGFAESFMNGSTLKTYDVFSGTSTDSAMAGLVTTLAEKEWKDIKTENILPSKLVHVSAEKEIHNFLKMSPLHLEAIISSKENGTMVSLTVKLGPTLKIQDPARTICEYIEGSSSN